MKKLILIDPPSPLDPIEDWERFLAHLKAKEQTRQIEDLTKWAEKELEKRKLDSQDEKK